MAKAEIGPFARTEPVLPKVILLGIGVEAERTFGQLLALPGLDGRPGVDAPRGDAGEDQQAKPKQKAKPRL